MSKIKSQEHNAVRVRALIGCGLVSVTVLFGVVSLSAREPLSRRQAQRTGDGAEAFEVASIKLADPNAPIKGPVCHGTNTPNQTPVGLGRCQFIGVTLKQLINTAYQMGNLLQSQALDQTITGGPAWVSTEKFDIQAKAQDPEHTTREQFFPMIQSLLVDRFKLKFHRGTIDVSGYALMVAKSGSRLKAPSDPNEPHRLGVSRGPEAGLQRLVGQMSGTNNLAQMLSNILLGQPVEDKTGITGPYDFTLTWAPGEGERGVPPSGSSAPTGPSLFTALQEQLGLRLEPQKVSVQTFIIDSAEKPTQF